MLNSSLPLKMLFPSSDCAKGLLFSKSEWRNIGSCLHLPTLLLLFEVGPPKISSKVTARSSLAHISIKNATFWSTSQASVSIHIPPIHVPSRDSGGFGARLCASWLFSRHHCNPSWDWLSGFLGLWKATKAGAVSYCHFNLVMFATEAYKASNILFK